MYNEGGIMYFGLILLLMGGCTSQKSPDVKTETVSSVDETLLLSSWPVRMADPKNRAQFEGDDGWTAYFQREYVQALPYMKGLPLARVHFELASMYQQAAMMHSYSIIHLYGTKETTAMVECLYLRGVAHAVLGEKEKALSVFTEFESLVSSIPEDRQEVAQQLVQRMQAWKQFLEQKTPLPSTLFFVDETNIRDGAPTIDPITPYFFYGPSLLEPEAPPIEIEMSEGTSLFVLSQWHKNQASEIIKEEKQSSQIQFVWNDRWNVSKKNQKASKQETSFGASIGDEWLFLSFFLMESDVAYMYDILQLNQIAQIDEHTFGDSGQQIYEITKKWSTKSILASQVAMAIQEISIPENLGGQEKYPNSGKKVFAVVPDIILELAGQLKDVSLEKMKQQQGRGDPVFIKFAEFAEISLLRMGVLVAEANGQYRDSGVLRLSVNDISQEATRDPLFQVAFGTWDVGNRFTIRAQDTFHRYSQSYPILESSRKPVDLLSIRIGRDSTGGGVAN